MDNALTRDELLDRLRQRLKDGRYSEMLQHLSREQLQKISAALDDLAGLAPERLVESRRAAVCRVEVVVTLGDSVPDIRTGLRENSSTGGSNKLVHRHITVGTPVKIRRNGAETSGIVQRCNRDRLGYSIGIRYERA